MIASMIVKRMIRSNWLMLNEDDFDVDTVLKGFLDDAVYDIGSDLGVGETIKGKKAIGDWVRRWKEEFPKRKFEVKNICFSSWPLSLKKVITIQWTLTQTDKQGKIFKYDGASIWHVKNFEVKHATEHISFAGLPKVSDLIAPLA